MENSKFPTCLVISSILATCIYISAAAQSFRRDGAQGINYANFVKNPSNRLNVAVLASLMVYRPVDCTHKCINNQDCYSVNFATTSSLDGTHSCELLSTDKFHKSDDLVPHESFDHFNIKTPCMSNPCQHGAAFCRPIYNRDDYECVCKEGFTGKYCGVENWVKMTPSSVCFSARDETYGAFTIPAAGNIITFKLTYLNGHVNCGGSAEYLSRWGCNWPGYAPYTMGVYITDTLKNRLLPANSGYKRGGINCLMNEYYSLSWATTEGNELRFDNFSAPLSVSSGQEYQVWFIEDLNGCSELGNGFEKTCAEVYGLYE